MIRLNTNLPEFFGDIAEVVRLFLGAVDISPDEGDQIITHVHSEENDVWTERFSMDGITQEHTSDAVHGGLVEKRMLKRAVKTCCFLMMKEKTGMTPPWGSLTGIRPTRILYELLEEKEPFLAKMNSLIPGVEVRAVNVCIDSMVIG